MNERIKELIKNMGIIPEDEHYDVAEAVIKQCIDVCQKVTDSGMFDSNQQYASAYCRDEIKKHFGVKE